MKRQKTNALRLLDAAGITYSTHAYEVDENDLSAVHVAAVLGQNPEMVFKTLLLRGDRNGVFVCIVPAAAEVDLKKAAKASGNKSCALTHVSELLSLTGYIRGGCSPIGMKRSYPMYIHTTCNLFPAIYISAGCRGLQVCLSPSDLIAFAHLTVTDLI